MTSVLAPPTRPRPDNQRFLLRDVGWEGYQALLKMVGDRPIRVTYDRGDVELMSPLAPHERSKKLLGRMVDTITDELGIPMLMYGSLTINRQDVDRGLEPDVCYYLASIPHLRDVMDIRLNRDPPDLAIEVDITSSSLDRLGIYAALGVPEVWRFDGETLTVLLRRPDGTYAASPTSAAFPFVPMGELVRFLLEYTGTDDTRWLHAFRAWVRAELVPRYRQPADGGEPT